MTATGTTMAKAKSGAGRDPDSWARKPIVLTMRGTPEFKAVLGRAAEFDGVTVTAFVDRAIRRYMKEIGYTEPLPRR